MFSSFDFSVSADDGAFSIIDPPGVGLPFALVPEPDAMSTLFLALLPLLTSRLVVANFYG